MWILKETKNQKLETNGKMILEWMEKYRLITLNDDERCKGLYTWNRGEQKCDRLCTHKRINV